MVDVGTDHALLPIYAVQRRGSPFVIASDINPGPLAAAKRAVSEAGLTSVIDTRLGPGLETVRPGEVDVVVIAGMGGHVMTEILQEASEVLTQVKRLILQPMGAARTVRLYLLGHGWSVVHEEIFLQVGKYYEFIVAEPTEEVTDYDAFLDSCSKAGRDEADTGPSSTFALYHDAIARDMALTFGPRLIQHPTTEFKEFILLEQNRWRDALKQVAQGRTAAAKEKASLLANQIAWVNQWLEETRGK